jgi:hypothetical protein
MVRTRGDIDMTEMENQIKFMLRKRERGINSTRDIFYVLANLKIIDGNRLSHIGFKGLNLNQWLDYLTKYAIKYGS